MPEFTYEVTPTGAGSERGLIVVSDDLAPFYRAQPGYIEVIREDTAAELRGDDLQAAAEAAGVPHASRLKADEKRAAIVAATDPEES